MTRYYWQLVMFNLPWMIVTVLLLAVVIHLWEGRK